MASVEVVGAIIGLTEFSAKILMRIAEFASAASSVPESLQPLTAELGLLTICLQNLQSSEFSDHDAAHIRPIVEDTADQVRFLNAKLNNMLPQANSSSFDTAIRAVKSLAKQEKFQAAVGQVHKNLVSLQACVHLHVASDIRRASKAINDKLDARLADDKRRRIFTWIDAYSPAKDLASHVERLSPGTGDWVYKNELYKEWLSQKNSVLLIHGPAGCGKTGLSSNIIRTLIRQQRESYVSGVAYFYIDGADTTRQFIDCIMRSILKQLALQKESSYEHLEAFYDRMTSMGRIDPLERCRALPEEMLLVLREIVESSDSSSTFIVLDALDETEDLEPLLEAINTLKSWSLQGLRFLLTGRLTSDVQAFKKTHADLEIALTPSMMQSDIERRVDHHLALTASKWSFDLREEVRTYLVGHSQGSFRWVECALIQLSRPDCTRESHVRRRLDSSPKTLHGIYEKILQDTLSTHPQSGKLFLHLMLSSTRWLTVSELSQALAVDVDCDDGFDIEDREFEPGWIMDICTGLTLTEWADDGKARMTWAHASVREFLTKTELVNTEALGTAATRSSRVHTTMACVCLLYLTSIDMENANYYIPDRYHFANYASFSLEDHLEYSLGSSDPRLLHLAQAFFTSQDKAFFRNWRALRYWKGMRKFDDELYNAVWSSQENLVRLLLAVGLDPNRRLYPEETCIQIAIQKKNASVLEALLNGGADPNEDCGWAGLPLVYAVLLNEPRLARTLLSYKANADLLVSEQKYRYTFFDSCSNEKTPISLVAIAVGRGSDDLVRILLETGADPDLRAPGGRTALEIAALKAKEQTCRILLDYEATFSTYLIRRPYYLLCQIRDRNTSLFELFLDRGFPRTNYTLSCAAFAGRLAETTSLLQEGLGAPTAGLTWNPVLLAVEGGHEKVLHALIESMGKPSEQVQFLALVCAAAFGHRHIIRYLMKQFPTCNNLAGSLGGLLLHAAISHDHIAVLSMLFRETNASLDGWYLCRERNGLDPLEDVVLNPVHLTASTGNRDIMSYILAHGAKVNISGGYYGSALQAAVIHRESPMIDLLLDRGADVNVSGGVYGTALQAAVAAYEDSVVYAYNIIELLVSRGADPNLGGGYFGSPLQCAVCKNLPNVVSLLLARGADVNLETKTLVEGLAGAAKPLTEGFRCQNALAAAIRAGNDNIFALLMMAGGDLAKIGRDGFPSALDLALQGGSAEILAVCAESSALLEDPISQRLFEHEVCDLKLVDRTDLSPLRWMAATRRRSQLSVLIEAGADVNHRSAKGWTALHDASVNGCNGIVIDLLFGEAEVDIESHDGTRPIHLATAAGCAPIVRSLLREQSDPSAGLVIAVQRGDCSMLELLLREGRSPVVARKRMAAAIIAARELADDLVVNLAHARMDSPSENVQEGAQPPTTTERRLRPRTDCDSNSQISGATQAEDEMPLEEEDDQGARWWSWTCLSDEEGYERCLGNGSHDAYQEYLPRYNSDTHEHVDKSGTDDDATIVCEGEETHDDGMTWTTWKLYEPATNVWKQVDWPIGAPKRDLKEMRKMTKLLALFNFRDGRSAEDVLYSSPRPVQDTDTNMDPAKKHRRRRSSNHGGMKCHTTARKQLSSSYHTAHVNH